MEQYKNIQDHPEFDKFYVKYDRFVKFDSKDANRNVIHIRNAIEKLIFNHIIIGRMYNRTKNILLRLNGVESEGYCPGYQSNGKNDVISVYVNLPDHPTVQDIAYVYDRILTRIGAYTQDDGSIKETDFSSPISFDIHLIRVSQNVREWYNNPTKHIKGSREELGEVRFKDFHVPYEGNTRIIFENKYRDTFPISDKISELKQ